MGTEGVSACLHYVSGGQSSFLQLLVLVEIRGLRSESNEFDCWFDSTKNIKTGRFGLDSPKGGVVWYGFFKFSAGYM